MSISKLSCGSFLLCSLLLAGCAEVDVGDASPSNDDASIELEQSAFEAGLNLLQNAQTRFDYPEAATLLEQAVEESPSDARARLSLIYAYSKRGRYEDCLPHLEALKGLAGALSEQDQMWLEALEHRVLDRRADEARAWKILVEAYPDDHWGWYELASAETSLENYEQSAVAANQALLLQPDSEKWSASWIYYIQSKALYRTGLYEAAIEAANAGRDNASTWRSTFYRKGLAQARLNPDRISEILEEYIRISRSENRIGEAYLQANIALFYFELGDYRTASETALGAWAMEQSAFAFYSSVYSLTEAGRLDEALALIEAHGPLFSEDAFALAAMGWAHFRADNLDDALEYLENAQSTAPRTNFQIKYQLEAVKQAIKRPNEAEAQPLGWIG